MLCCLLSSYTFNSLEILDYRLLLSLLLYFSVLLSLFDKTPNLSGALSLILLH